MQFFCHDEYIYTEIISEPLNRNWFSAILVEVALVVKKNALRNLSDRLHYKLNCISVYNNFLNVI